MAARETRTLSDLESTHFHSHLETCETCRQASTLRSEDDWRWVVRVSGDAMDAATGLVIPIVDPSVFEIEGEVASGGMGRILRARDRRLGRVIAIKEVLGPELHERFQREALITARLQHPAIVPIYEAGTWPDGSGFYTMRLVPGGTLQQALDGTPDLPGRLALLHHVVAVTEAVAYAHARGVIHRDLKPGNVLVGELGETVVIDWGLAKYLDTDDLPATEGDPTQASDLTRVGSVLGTPGFMAPEQARGEVLDERADVFALGAILYTVLAGAPPYADELALVGPDAVVAVSSLRPPRSIDELAPEAPADLRAIVRTAMAWSRTDRYRTAREMVEQLRRFEAGQLLARQYGVGELIARWVRRHRAAVAAASIALLVVLGFGTYALVNVTRSRTAERAARAQSERARDDSERSLAALLEEQGRTEVEAGRPDRALVYLSEALARGRDTVPLRHLLGAALRDRPEELLRDTLAPFADDVDTLAFTPGGELVIIADDGDLSIWKDRTRTHHHTVSDVTLSWISRDAETVITLGDGAKVEAWDPRSGARRWSVKGATGFESGAEIAFAPGTTNVAIVERAATAPLLVLDLATGARRAALAIEQSPLVAVAYSDDGTRLVAADEQGALRVWNADTFEVVTTVRAATKRAVVAFVGPDQLVTAGGRSAEVWSLAPAPRVVARIEHAATVAKLVVSRVTGLVATSDERGTVRVFTATGKLMGTAFEPRNIAALAFSPDGQSLLGVGSYGQAYVWRTQPLQLVRAFEVVGESFWGAAWSHDGARLASYATDHRVRVWGTPRGNLRERARADRVAVLGDAWLAATRDGAIVRSFDTQKIVTTLPPLGTTQHDRYGMAVSRDGARALVVVRSKPGAETVTFAVVSLRDGRRLLEIETEDARLSADGQRVAAVELPVGKPARARLIDVTTGATLAEVAFPLDRPWPSGALAAPDGRLLVLDHKPPLALPDLGARAPAVRLGVAELDGAVIDPTDRWVAAWRWSDWQISVHDLRTGARVVAWEGPQYVNAIKFSGDGERMAIQAGDLVEVHDVGTPQARISVGQVVEAAFALDPTGARLAVGHADGTIAILDTTRGGALEVLRGHTAQVVRVSFSANGAYLLGLAGDGTVTVWDLGLETRSPREIAALAATAPWQLADGTLVRRP